MKERLITLGTALLALALVIFILSPQDSGTEKPVSVPTTEDRGSDGLKGLFTWLQREQIAVVSFRKRFTELFQDKSMPDQGNILILNMPPPREVRETEWAALSRWLDKGNSLIILGAVYHHPAWATGEDCFCDVKKFLSTYNWELYGDSDGDGDIDEEGEEGDEAEIENHENQKPKSTKSTNFKESIAAIQASVKEQIAQESTLSSVAMHPLLEGVKTLAVQTTPFLLKKQWTLESSDKANLAFRLLRIADQNTIAAWQMSAGTGKIVLMLTPNMFSNTHLNLADNARFLSNLIGQSLAPKGHLLFDDYHFGLSELYDPERFFKDERLHKTLACLLLFWLCYVIGYTTRLAPVRSQVTRLSTCDFIKVMAGFFARRVKKHILAEALVKHLLADIHHHRRLREEAEVWQFLKQHGQITGEQINLLKLAQAGQRLSLLRLTNTINYIRTVTL